MRYPHFVLRARRWVSFDRGMGDALGMGMTLSAPLDSRADDAGKLELDNPNPFEEEETGGMEFSGKGWKCFGIFCCLRLPSSPQSHAPIV
jgi:hypothetical protein